MYCQANRYHFCTKANQLFSSFLKINTNQDDSLLKYFLKNNDNADILIIVICRFKRRCFIFLFENYQNCCRFHIIYQIRRDPTKQFYIAHHPFYFSVNNVNKFWMFSKTILVIYKHIIVSRRIINDFYKLIQFV